MNKIDVKDRKILYQLDLNARQSYTQIGKKVNLPKSVVVYRINKLIEKGIIKNFYTIIDLHKLGYHILRFYFTYQYITPDKKREIINYLQRYKHTGVIHTTEGAYDLVVYIFIKNLNDFFPFWEETLSLYRDYFSTQILSIYEKEYAYNYSLLINNTTNRKKISILEGKNIVETSTLDIKILKLIASDARLPSKEVAKKLNVSSVTIANRIKKLIDNNIIQCFRTNIDFTKLGYRWYKVDITLKDHKKLNQIISYLQNNPNFVGVDKTLGYVDLEIELYLKNISEIHTIMEDLSVKFPNSIKQYTYVYVIKTHKYEFFPFS